MLKMSETPADSSNTYCLINWEKNIVKAAAATPKQSNALTKKFVHKSHKKRVFYNFNMGYWWLASWSMNIKTLEPCLLKILTYSLYCISHVFI